MRGAWFSLGVFLSIASFGCGSDEDGGSNATGSGGSGGSGGANTGGANTGGSVSTGGSGGAIASGGSGGDTTGSGGSVSGTGGAPSGFEGDELVPWHGGPSYFDQWPNGPESSPDFFMISVWLQTPSNAGRYQDVGVNFFTGLWDGPTDEQLDTLAAEAMPVVCDQSGVWQSHLDDGTIRAWLQQDEPDNAQSDGMGGYDPCIDPAVIVANYDEMVANDPSRPVYLNLGRGVADTEWVGRGDCTGQTEMYAEYAAGADILSYDIYPVNQGTDLELVATGMDNLREWSNYEKPVVMAIEGSNYDDTARPSPEQIRTEVWMALVHGAAGILYFCHRFQPTFSETDCLDDAPTQTALTEINAQITSLAAVLNTQSVSNGVTVESSNAAVPVDTMLKRAGGVTYVFAVAMRGDATTATFTLRDFPGAATVTVLDEDRTITSTDGVFEDSFDPYAVHLYSVPNP